MEIKLRKLSRKDFSKVISFAIEGMHFNRYIDHPLALRLYGRYFLYLELERATRVLAAYMDDRIVGVLLADMKNEQKQYSSLWQRFYIKAFKAIVTAVVRGDPNSYDETNKGMLHDYLKRSNPDGEICFLAADPAMQGMGIGSLLLEEIGKRKRDKLIYLFTDDNCTYQFYEHKGFKRSEEKKIQMELEGKVVPLTCFLYSKQL